MILFAEPSGLSIFLTILFAGSIGSFLANEIFHSCNVRAGDPLNDGSPMQRSQCDTCHCQLAWFENIPVVSYWLLNARCRSCKSPIARVYPMVETFSVVCGLGLLWAVKEPLIAMLLFGMAVTLFFIAWVDSVTHYISDSALHWLYAFSALYLALSDRPVPIEMGLMGAVLGFVLLESLRLLFERVRGYEGMGCGDPRLMFGLGLLLGIEGVLHAITIAGVIAAAVWLASSLHTNNFMAKLQIPFAPCLIAGALAIHGFRAL